MLLRKFWEVYGIARICVLIAFLGAIVCQAMPGYCSWFEADFRSPEMQSMAKESDDKQNERSYEKYQENEKDGKETSDRDLDRAADWHRDHSA